jgi:predicted house-cleaning NTP pyrophosphatase (Maf/HAM1 superfamily)
LLFDFRQQLLPLEVRMHNKPSNRKRILAARSFHSNPQQSTGRYRFFVLAAEFIPSINERCFNGIFGLPIPHLQAYLAEFRFL